MIGTTIRMSVCGQKLSVIDAPDPLIAGSKGMLSLAIDFDGGWGGWRAAVDFGDIAVPVISGRCAVPDSEAAKKAIRMRVVGARGDSRVSTNTVLVRQREA